MKNKMTDLRNHLFEELERIKDRDTSFDVERAKAIIEIAKAITDTAKVEVAFIAETGANGSEFFDHELPAIEHRPTRGIAKRLNAN